MKQIDKVMTPSLEFPRQSVHGKSAPIPQRGSFLGKWLRHLFLWIPIQEQRKRLSREVNIHFDSTIAYGPFTGLRLTKKTWWGAKDRAAMILGMYEQEVLEAIFSAPECYNHFIDLGAADGYYATGALFSGRFQSALCYEMSVRGRKVIRSNAELNGTCAALEIRGMAKDGFSHDVPLEVRARSLLLIDIEGGEFDLCSVDFFTAFAESIIIIEIHDFFVRDGKERFRQLLDLASKNFAITFLTTAQRDFSAFRELDFYEDTDRWLMCSEGRKQRMQWIKLEPLSVGVKPTATA